MNQEPLEFWVVEGKVQLEALASASPYAKPCAHAALAIVPCLKAEGLPCPDMAEQDMGAAIENILVEAAELGLGAVWQGIYPMEERVRAAAQVLGIPDDAGLAPSQSLRSDIPQSPSLPQVLAASILPWCTGSDSGEAWKQKGVGTAGSLPHLVHRAFYSVFS